MTSLFPSKFDYDEAYICLLELLYTGEHN
jgi:hypothetical protein